MISDATLIKRWTNDADSDAFAEIVARHAGMVYGTCRRILGETGEAEEVTQECFIKLGRIRRVKGTSLGGLLHTMATHLALNQLRAQQHRRERELAYALKQAPATETTWNDVQPHIDAAISDLPEKFRTPLIAHFMEGQTYTKIARALNMHESTIRYRAKQGIQHVRVHLKQRGLTIGAPVFIALLSTHAQAAEIPAVLTAALGRTALTGASTVTTMGTLSGGLFNASNATITAGAVLMWKKVTGALVVVAIGVGAGFVLYPGSEVKEEEAKPEVAPVTTTTIEHEPAASVAEIPEVASTIDPSVMESDAMATAIATLMEKAMTAGLANAVAKRSSDVTGDNGAHYFLLATELLSQLNADEIMELFAVLKEEGRLDDPELWAAFDTLQDVFDAILQGLDMEQIQMPPVDSLAEPMPYLSQFRAISKLMAMQAEMYASVGDHASAVEWYMAGLDFANESSRGGVLISGLVGLVSQEVVMNSLQEWTVSGAASPIEYQSMLHGLQDWEGRLTGIAGNGWEDIDVLQRSLLGQAGVGEEFQRLLLAEGGSDPAFPADEIASMNDAQLRALLEGALDDYGDRVSFWSVPYYEAWEAPQSSNNPFGQLMLEGVQNVHATETLALARLAGLQTNIAIQLYVQEYNGYPNTLESLVPTHLPVMPNDPFSGDLLGYTRDQTGYTLYSVGPDLCDDGGNPLQGDGSLIDRQGDVVLYERQ